MKCFLILIFIFSCVYNYDPKLYNKSITRRIEMNSKDIMSYSQDKKVIQYKIELDLYINMAKNKVEGKARIHFKCIDIKADYIILDTRDLLIKKVEDDQKRKLFHMFVKHPEANKNLGKGLIIKFVQQGCYLDSFIDVYYATSPNAIGIHFSEGSILNNKSFSLMYTHGEAIYSRSFVPCQDTPSLKVKLTAAIRIDKPYTVLFSGVKKQLNNDTNNKIYNYFYFEQNDPIPTYLIALVAGNLSKKELSKRCEVYGEFTVLQKYISAFENCDKYINFFEKYGKLKFEKIVYVVVPPDFPYSGTEHPYAILINENLLNNDRTFIGTIAHEIAHFWSGNLVTMEHWGNFYLNEGLTTYLTRKAIKEVHGIEQYNYEMNKGINGLQNQLETFRKKYADNPTLRSVNPILKKQDPYTFFSKIPYEKGCFFFHYLETLLSDEILIKMLKDYFEHFSFKNVNTKLFISFIQNKIQKYLGKEKGNSLIKAIDWKEWFFGTENIPVKFEFDSTLHIEFDQFYKQFTKNPDSKIIESLKTATTMKKAHFVDKCIHNIHKLSKKAINVLKKLIKENIFSFSDLKVKTHILQYYLLPENQRLDSLLELLYTTRSFNRHQVIELFDILKNNENLSINELKQIIKVHKMKFNPITLERLKEHLNIIKNDK